ncbi:MAG TPA: hypothetical protein PKA20_19635 [Burkholderiaceae bacterium]|nr:hypothetical protein [Burkholderiaceae bacterium]
MQALTKLPRLPILAGLGVPAGDIGQRHDGILGTASAEEQQMPAKVPSIEAERQ